MGWNCDLRENRDVATIREHQWSSGERVVVSFEKLDEMTTRDHDSVACQLTTGDPNHLAIIRNERIHSHSSFGESHPLSRSVVRRFRHWSFDGRPLISMNAFITTYAPLDLSEMIIPMEL
jgi:hypothetical protein